MGWFTGRVRLPAYLIAPLAKMHLLPLLVKRFLTTLQALFRSGVAHMGLSEHDEACMPLLPCQQLDDGQRSLLATYRLHNGYGSCISCQQLRGAYYILSIGWVQLTGCLLFAC